MSNMNRSVVILPSIINTIQNSLGAIDSVDGHPFLKKTAVYQDV